MYDNHQDNNLLSPESWLLETMKGFKYMWLRWTVYIEAFLEHVGKIYCRTNVHSQGQSFSYAAFVGCWTKATQQKRTREAVCLERFNVQHSDIKSDEKSQCKIFIHLYKCEEIKESVWERPEIHLSPEIQNDPEGIVAHILMLIL